MVDQARHTSGTEEPLLVLCIFQCKNAACVATECVFESKGLLVPDLGKCQQRFGPHVWFDHGPGYRGSDCQKICIRLLLLD